MSISQIYKAIRIAWNINPRWFIVSIIFRIFFGLLPLGTLWVTKELVDAVTHLIQGELSEDKLIIKFLALQLIITIAQSAIRYYCDFFDKKMEYDLDYHLNQRVTEKSLIVPYSYFDLPEFYNHHDRLKSTKLGSNILSPLKNILSIFESLLSLFSYLGFLFIIHWSLVILSLLSCIPILLIQSKYSNSKYSLLKAQTPELREARYIQSLIFNRQSAKEIRIFELGEYFLERWMKLFQKNNIDLLMIIKNEKKAMILLDAFTALLFGISAFIVVSLLKLGRVSLGQFVSLTQSIRGAQGAVNAIAFYLSTIYESNFYLKDMLEYLDFERKDIEKLPSPKEQLNLFSFKNCITFNKVSFSYPMSNKNALNSLNFQIKQGEKVAIVGQNGSGKTTLVKCLMGLYPISEGSITFDGTDINIINKKQLRKNITVIFQDFMKYAFTVKDNVVFGDIERQEDLHHLESVAKKSDIAPFVNNFSSGYNTFLGKLLKEGEDLSGGQWQKIAIGRALFSESEIIILDEPTAALDPQSELEIFEKFDELTNGKTTIYISHRMASSVLADKILVLKDGFLIEVGTHKELMKKQQEYYKMFQMQAKWYA